MDALILLGMIGCVIIAVVSTVRSLVGGAKTPPRRSSNPIEIRVQLVATGLSAPPPPPSPVAPLNPERFRWTGAARAPSVRQPTGKRPLDI